MQGVVKSYDPATRDGVVVSDGSAFTEHEFAVNALEGSIFRMLRPGQRIVFDLDDQSRATALRLGSEVDMATPERASSIEETSPEAETSNEELPNQ